MGIKTGTAQYVTILRTRCCALKMYARIEKQPEAECVVLIVVSVHTFPPYLPSSWRPTLTTRMAYQPEPQTRRVPTACADAMSWPLGPAIFSKASTQCQEEPRKILGTTPSVHCTGFSSVAALPSQKKHAAVHETCSETACPIPGDRECNVATSDKPSQHHA